MRHGRRRRIKRAPECRLSGQHSNLPRSLRTLGDVNYLILPSSAEEFLKAQSPIQRADLSRLRPAQSNAQHDKDRSDPSCNDRNDRPK